MIGILVRIRDHGHVSGLTSVTYNLYVYVYIYIYVCMYYVVGPHSLQTWRR